LADAFGIPQYLVVPESQDTPAPIFKPPCTTNVPFVVRMLPSIGLDDKEILRAGKIDDRGFDRKLSTKLETTEPQIAQRTPKALSRLGGVSP
jgi:hypothetical protein